MKANNIIDTAVVGRTIILTSLELLVIKNKWEEIVNSSQNATEVPESIVQFDQFITRLLGEDVISFEQVEQDLFETKSKSYRQPESAKRAGKIDIPLTRL